MKIAAIDVGLKNLSYVILTYPTLTHPTDTLNAAKELLGQCHVCEWKVESLVMVNGSSVLEKTISACINFVDTHLSEFSGCEKIIIEQQMCDKMRVISASLATCLKTRIPNAHVHFQSSKYKLKWSDATTFYSLYNISSYHHRKKTAVKLVQELIMGLSNFESYFAIHTKKDDLADSLLHAAYYMVTATNHKKRKLTYPSTPLVPE